MNYRAIHIDTDGIVFTVEAAVTFYEPFGAGSRMFDKETDSVSVYAETAEEALEIGLGFFKTELWKDVLSGREGFYTVESIKVLPGPMFLLIKSDD